MVQSLDMASPTVGELGQPLSDLGTVLPLQLGPQDDVFFLTFDNLNGVLFNRTDYPMLVESDYVATAEEQTSDVGVKTFDEIDATYAWITGVNRVTYTDALGDFVVDETYQELRQSLPAVEDPATFLSSHQVAIAQLAIQYCDAAVEDSTIWPASFFSQPAATAFSVGNRGTFVEPLILRAAGHDSDDPQIMSQPSYTAIYSELASFPGAGLRPNNLIDRLLAPGTSDTRAIAKGVCAATLGSAITLVQ